jgi:hypothetical protein
MAKKDHEPKPDPKTDVVDLTPKKCPHCTEACSGEKIPFHLPVVEDVKDEAGNTVPRIVGFEDVCPIAFAFRIAPQQPQRWAPGSYAAATCARCGTLQVVFAAARSCQKCGGPTGAMSAERPPKTLLPVVS